MGRFINSFSFFLLASTRTRRGPRAPAASISDCGVERTTFAISLHRSLFMISLAECRISSDGHAIDRGDRYHASRSAHHFGDFRIA
jgi:hypothetical protein